MDLWQLRTLSIVAKTLHFTRAAEELHLSQPAVSHHIKALEQEIGETLFVRGADGITLTAAGKSAYEYAKKILDIADEMKVVLQERSETIRGKLVLGGSFEGLDNPLYALYGGFKELFGDVEIKYQGEQRPEDIIEKLAKGNLDLGLVADDYLQPDLISIPYGEYDLMPVVGSGHPLAERPEILPEDLLNEDWVLFDNSSRFRGYVEDLFKGVGFRPKSVIETNDGGLIKAMVSRGKHVSCLPSWGVSYDREYGGIIPINIEGWSRKIQVSLVWNPSRVSLGLRALIIYLLEADVKGVDLFRMKLT